MARESGGRDGSGAPRREQDSREKRIEELQRENAKLIHDLDRTTRDLDRTTRDRDRWKRRSEDLKKQLDEARRAAKRQAAPFAKERPQGSGKPGRRSGAQYGRQGSRRRPPRVNETHRAPGNWPTTFTDGRWVPPACHRQAKPAAVVATAMNPTRQSNQPRSRVQDPCPFKLISGSPQTSVGRGAAVSGSARIVAAQPWGSAGRAFT